MTDTELSAIAARVQAEKCKGFPMRMRHTPDCPVGKHCEDPFCHFGGECTCEVDNIAKMAREDLPRVLASLLAANKECAELRYQNSQLKLEMSRLVLADEKAVP